MKKTVSITVVCGLLASAAILYGIYSVTGFVFSGSNENEDTTAAASVDAEEKNQDTESDNEFDETNSGGSEADSDRVYFMSDHYFYLDRSDHDDAVNYQDGKEEKANELIAELHRVMNDIVGYGNIETVSFERIRDGKYNENMTVREGVHELKENLISDSRAMHDLRNLDNFYSLATSAQTEDRMALRYAHRIIHDLDVHINGQGDDDSRDIWGVTEAFGTDSQINRLYDYIREHGYVESD